MSDKTISGIAIPQWMKGQSQSPSGFDPSTLSPPSYDHEFIHLRFTNKEAESSMMGPELYKGRLSEQKTNRPHGVEDGFNGLKSECANSVVACAQKLLGVSHNRQRRNSKSLPASPLGSPDSRRRIVNRFFTLEEDRDNSGSTSSLLDVVTRDPGLRAKSVAPGNQPPNESVFLSGPKPSEYREMNFWSPTSM